MKRKTTHVVGSGNIFRDLDYPNPEEALAKAALLQKLNSIIESRGLTQKQAAQVLCIDQPKVSALRRGRLSGFSLERLLRFLILLGRDVRIVIRTPRRRGEASRLRVA